MAQSANDQAANIARISEPNFSFRWMDIHIDIFWIEIDKQSRHWVTVPRQKILISGADHPVEHTVFDRATIHKQVLALCIAAIEGR